mmetsp:Transcript_113612/g.316116  ORF Transcript_113612/g.316116 Transcript_113612/m.316116 type:complete len:160 (+) Transcript_113612:193-672(+)
MLLKSFMLATLVKTKNGAAGTFNTSHNFGVSSASSSSKFVANPASLSSLPRRRSSLVADFGESLPAAGERARPGDATARAPRARSGVLRLRYAATGNTGGNLGFKLTLCRTLGGGGNRPSNCDVRNDEAGDTVCSRGSRGDRGKGGGRGAEEVAEVGRG